MEDTRELGFEQRMSDHEAVMWHVEKDPWLNPNGAAIVILDRPLDMPQLRRRMRYAVSQIPRLYERVVPGLGRLAPPVWAPDAEFDFDYHVRHVSLPEPGTERQLYDLATRLYEDPFDRTRPLWIFVAIDGLEGGRGALFSKTHHAVSDGIGALRMAESFQELKRREKQPPEVDLEGMIARAAEEAEGKETGGNIGSSFVGTAARSMSHVMRRQAGVARRAAGEAVIWPSDPRRAVDVAQGVADRVLSTIEQMTGAGSETPGGSPLWKPRSRRRHIDAITVPLDDLKRGAKALGGSINDAFVTGTVVGAVEYHEAEGIPLDALNISFVVSTRTDSAIGGNAFTPAPVQVPAGPMALADRFAEIRDRMAARREEVLEGGGGLGALMGLATMLPTSVLTRTVRAAASRMDFATSNLRGAPFPVFVSGAKVLRNIPIGPVAGTAANITALSYNGALDMGIVTDPAAIDQPERLSSCMEEAFRELVKAG